jgi:hypothetical protein
MLFYHLLALSIYPNARHSNCKQQGIKAAAPHHITIYAYLNAHPQQHSS